MKVLTNFDYEIQYRPGKENIVANAISRPPIEEVIKTLTLVTNSIMEQVIAACTDDKEAQALREILSNEDTSKESCYHQYQLKDNAIYYKDRLYIPNNQDLQRTILFECHDAPTAGHLGFDKCYEVISQNFYWPRMAD